MSEDVRPVVTAFDGSPESVAAVREAAALVGHRPLLVLTVWEPNLAMAMVTTPDVMGTPYSLPNPEDVEAVDNIREEHASAVAQSGVELARSLGATAEALVVGDGLNVADTVAAIAKERDAAAIVVGSRGLGAVKAKLMGSTSRRLLHDSPRPILVVPSHHDHD